MMRRKEMKAIIEERGERIGLLEQRLETLEQLLDGYKAREQAIVDSLSQASETAKQRVAEAERRAQQLVTAAESEAGTLAFTAKTQADSLLSEARAQADKLAGESRAESERLLSEARAEKERMLEKTEKTVRAYEEKLKSYNADLDRSAAEVEATAARYASFIKERKIDTGELFNEIGGGSTMVTLSGADALPDPAGDPKTLMQNIYKLQNRDIPDEIGAPPELIEEIIADLGPRPAEVAEPELAPAPEPEPAPAPAVIEPETEWQPEPEPEWRPEDEPESAPRVSELLPDAGEEDVSLDALLDEIIAAGDI